MTRPAPAPNGPQSRQEAPNPPPPAPDATPTNLSPQNAVTTRDHRWPLCAQCGTTTRELTESIHGPLCPRCAWRQTEHDQPGHGLSASTYGFTSETE